MTFQKVLKKSLSALICCVLIIANFGDSTFKAEEKKPIPEAENVQVKEIYKGVTLTSFEVGQKSSYALNKFKIVEFNPNQSDLYIDVTNAADYSNELKTVMQTVEDFNKNNKAGKTAIAAVNGDLWMVSYAHARVEGAGTNYGGFSDAVVTAELTVPRGFNMYDGEIITSSHMSLEKPFEGEFQSFGFTADNKPYLGQPKTVTKIKNATKDTTMAINGINRLPVKDALVMYTDKGVLSNYAVSDAYEIVVDCDYDYVVKHGETIKGKVTAICKEGDADPQMQANRIILTARGRAEKRITDYEIGDEVEISITVKDDFGNDEVWQNEIKNAVGGHMVFAKNGQYSDLGAPTNYPSTIIAETNSGNIMFIQNDGRQEGYSLGLRHSDCDNLARELDLKNAFIVDGGGSSTLIALENDGYKLVNRPSDKDSNGNYGATRTVVNSVIVSHGKDRNAPPEENIESNVTQAPDSDQTSDVANETKNPEEQDETKNSEKQDETNSSEKSEKKEPGKGWNIALIVGSIVCFVIAVLLAIRSANKKFGK